VARPTLLTSELGERLVAALRAGNVIHVACEAVGIDRRTYSRWMERGRSGRARDNAYRELRAQVESARAEAEARAVTQIARAAAEDWRAAAWLLERGFPDRWGRPAERVQVIEVPAEPEPEHDPFEEVDELAEKRRNRTV
jgi:transposase